MHQTSFLAMVKCNHICVEVSNTKENAIIIINVIAFSSYVSIAVLQINHLLHRLLAGAHDQLIFPITQIAGDCQKIHHLFQWM